MNSLAAIADPTRRQIIETLSGGARASGEIARKFAISAPAISQHLKVLREARLVQVRVEAQRRIYELNPEGLAEIEAWIGRVRQFWGGRLDALERELRKPQPARNKRSKR